MRRGVNDSNDRASFYRLYHPHVNRLGKNKLSPMSSSFVKSFAPLELVSVTLGLCVLIYIAYSQSYLDILRILHFVSGTGLIFCIFSILQLIITIIH